MLISKYTPFTREMFTEPLFWWQEVINFEDYEASLHTDYCFAIKVSHF